MTSSPLLDSTDEIHIPQFGLGTWNLGRAAEGAVRAALEVGYRHVDSADIYGSHKPIARAISQSGLPRAEVFIVTKLWHNSMGEKDVDPAVDRFLKELDTDFIDLLLIHWPPRSTPIPETLGAMERARNAGKIRAIGVSNFYMGEMREALESGVPVVNNQIEYNLNHQPQEVLDFCQENGVTVTAYSPLERGSGQQEALVAELGEKYEAPREQVLLNWLMAKGMIQIPRSSRQEHIKANWESLNWEMEAGDVKELDNLTS